MAYTATAKIKHRWLNSDAGSLCLGNFEPNGEGEGVFFDSRVLQRFVKYYILLSTITMIYGMLETERGTKFTMMA